MNEEQGPVAWVGLVIGLAIMAFGALGLFRAASGLNVRTILVWMVGADLLHDLVVAPAVGVAGLLLARVVPRAWRPAVRAGSVASGVILLVAYPLLRGFGRDHVPDNRSVLPLDYPIAVATVLAVVWATALCWGYGAWRRGRRIST
jgi:hypothetical protein